MGQQTAPAWSLQNSGCHPEHLLYQYDVSTVDDLLILCSVMFVLFKCRFGPLLQNFNKTDLSVNKSLKLIFQDAPCSSHYL